LDAHPYGYGHPGCISNQHTFADNDGYVHRHADAVLHADRHCDADGDPDSNEHGYADSNRDC
jgi:hypothetical protein